MSIKAGDPVYVDIGTVGNPEWASGVLAKTKKANSDYVQLDKPIDDGQSFFLLIDESNKLDTADEAEKKGYLRKRDPAGSGRTKKSKRRARKTRRRHK